MRVADWNLKLLRDGLRLGGIGPEPRLSAIITSLSEIRALPGAGDVEGESVGRALAAVGEPREGDDPATAARRQTARAVGCYMAGIVNGGQVYPPDQTALPWFQAQIDAWAESDDARHKAMAATARRERDELLETLTTRPG